MSFVCLLQMKASGVSVPEVKKSFMVITDEKAEAPKFNDEEFYRISTSVIFKVNRTQINPDDEFYQVYRNQILPAVNARHLQLRKIYIRGAASPEGPYENNRRLAHGRSAALLDLLQRDLAHQYEDAEVDQNAVTEDYGYLCLLMHEAGDADYNVVKRIFDDCGEDELCCKERLMSWRGGALWQRLLKEYFPQLRAARVILWFSEPDALHAPLEVGSVSAEDMGITKPSVQLPTVQFPDALVAGEGQRARHERRHVVAARTNLVHDLFYMPGFGFAPSPNLQFEIYPLSGHLTYNVGITWGTLRHWKTHEFWQVRDIQAELRRYFKGHGQFLGFYLGAYAHGGKYGIGLNEEKGWQGEYGGLGLTGGYTMPLTKKGNFRLEFMLAAGAIGTRFDPYVYGNPVTGTVDGYYYYKYLGSASDFRRRNHQSLYFGPTNLGIQLTYDIIYRKMPPRRHRK